jgi:hypothetical protein
VNPSSWSDALKNLSPTYLLLSGFPYASLVLAKATVATRVASGYDGSRDRRMGREHIEHAIEPNGAA